MYLSKLNDRYGTLGLAEDTWALNEGVIDEDGFLKQAYLYFEEREAQLFTALEKTRRGLTVCVFDTPDRIQHMFFRCLDPTHPANEGKETEKYRGVIEDVYRRMDDLVGRVMARLDDKSVLIVMSDHGFTPFRRGVNINTWLLQNGYLALKDGKTTSGEWFADVDWSRTRAYCLGLTGIFINRQGREGQGIVDEGAELRLLKRELVTKLTGLVDAETGQLAIREVQDCRGDVLGTLPRQRTRSAARVQRRVSDLLGMRQRQGHPLRLREQHEAMERGSLRRSQARPRHLLLQPPDQRACAGHSRRGAHRAATLRRRHPSLHGRQALAGRTPDP